MIDIKINADLIDIDKFDLSLEFVGKSILPESLGLDSSICSWLRGRPYDLKIICPRYKHPEELQTYLVIDDYEVVCFPQLTLSEDDAMYFKLSWG